MARHKAKLAYIDNDSARRAAFRKRKKSLLKKVSELSTLCGVEACAIVYGAQETEPESWPSGPEAQRILEKFKNMPAVEQTKKMMSQEGFYRQRMTKVREQLKKQEKENQVAEMTILLSQIVAGRSLDYLSLADLSDLDWLVNVKLKEVGERIESLQESPVLVDGLRKFL